MQASKAMKATLRIVATTALLLGAGGCDVSVEDGNFSVDLVSGKATDESQRAYTVASDGEIDIDNGFGSVEVTASDTSQIEVAISRQAKARTDEAAQALLEQIEIREEVTPGRVRLRTDAPRRGVEVRYIVRAPRGLATVIETRNGAVRIQGMEGAVRATARNGRFEGEALHGKVQVDTVNGPIGVNFAALEGDVTLKTVNGPIRMTIPVTAHANLSARVVNGRIQASDLDFDTLDEPSPREMDAQLNGGGVRVHLETTNGPIVISGQN